MFGLSFWRLLSHALLSFVVAFIVGNLLVIRVAVAPTSSEKAAGLPVSIAPGDEYLSWPTGVLMICTFVGLLLRDVRARPVK